MFEYVVRRRPDIDNRHRKAAGPRGTAAGLAEPPVPSDAFVVGMLAVPGFGPEQVITDDRTRPPVDLRDHIDRETFIDVSFCATYVETMTSDGLGGDLCGGSDSSSGAGQTLVWRRLGNSAGTGGRLRGFKIVVGVAAVLSLGALAVVLVPAANAADSPELVLRRYVQATLADHDGAAAAALTCRAAQLDVIGRWEQDLAARERRFDLPPLHVDVSAYTGSRSGRRITAFTEIAVALVVDGQLQQRRTRAYTFVLVQQDGWKVCGASETD